VDERELEELLTFTKGILTIALIYGCVLALASVAWTFLDPIADIVFAKALKAGKAVAEWLK
jgi:hypothetical protein